MFDFALISIYLHPSIPSTQLHLHARSRACDTIGIRGHATNHTRFIRCVGNMDDISGRPTCLRCQGYIGYSETPASVGGIGIYGYAVRLRQLYIRDAP